MSSRPVIAPDSRVAVSSNAIWSTVPGGAVVLDPVSGHYFGLEGVAARAWEFMAESTTLDALVDSITREFEVDPATCEQDLRSLLEDFVGRGWVVCEDATA